MRARHGTPNKILFNLSALILCSLHVSPAEFWVQGSSKEKWFCDAVAAVIQFKVILIRQETWFVICGSRQEFPLYFLTEIRIPCIAFRFFIHGILIELLKILFLSSSPSFLSRVWNMTLMKHVLPLPSSLIRLERQFLANMNTTAIRKLVFMFTATLKDSRARPEHRRRFRA